MPLDIEGYANGDVVTYEASGAISEGNVVEVSSAGVVTEIATAANTVKGVALEDAAGGENVAVRLRGNPTANVESTVTAGDFLASTATGTLDTSTSAVAPVIVAEEDAANGTAEVSIR